MVFRRAQTAGSASPDDWADCSTDLSEPGNPGAAGRGSSHRLGSTERGQSLGAVVFGGAHPLPATLYCRESVELGVVASHAYPLSFNLSLRAQRGNLVTIGNMVQARGSPRRCAPRDDELGTHEVVTFITAMQTRLYYARIVIDPNHGDCYNCPNAATIAAGHLCPAVSLTMKSQREGLYGYHL